MAEIPDHEPVDLWRTPACEEMEEELAEAAHIQREGGDLAAHNPAIARHLEECERCRTTLDELLKEPDLLSESDIEVDSTERRERYLVAALAEPEQIKRLRAATLLGAAPRIGAAALAALAQAAAGDADKDVRAAALRALAAHDSAQLGKGGVMWTLSAEEGELRLALEGLPPSFENTTPMLALPAALRDALPGVEWASTGLGLVTADAAVREGRLDVRLGRMLDPSAEPKLSPELERLFVLNPRSPREGERS